MSSLTRYAASSAMRQAGWLRQQLPRAAAVHTAPGSTDEDTVHHDVYAREEHKWDYDTLTGGPRQERFPATIHIPEGGARVSVPDFPSIVRSSLAEPNYGSFGFSMRDPPYEYVPKRRASTTIAPAGPAAAASAAEFKISAAVYAPEEHAWEEGRPLPVVSGTWHKADC